MKLLYDQNLSSRLVLRLADLYPGSAHVRDAGLADADDRRVWAYAGAEGFAIVSKDADFYELLLCLGPPPKVIWIRRGNCSTSELERILRRHSADLLALEQDGSAGSLILF